MAQGSTGFSKQEIDALMKVLDECGIGFDIQDPLGVAYLKLCGMRTEVS